MSAPAIEFDRVSVRYEAHDPPVIDEVTIGLAAGERAALVGLNGSGKTTLLMAAVGLVGCTGEIRVGGAALRGRAIKAVREGVGFLFNVPEDQVLFPRVVDDTAFALLRKGHAAPECASRARAMLEALGVGPLADCPVHHLSHGQKQRVALAGALVSNPPLLLLDEPSAALDPPGRRDLARLLSGLGAAMLIATHDLEFAAAVCGRFILIEGGRVAYDGPDAAQVAARWP